MWRRSAAQRVVVRLEHDPLQLAVERADEHRHQPPHAQLAIGRVGGERPRGRQHDPVALAQEDVDPGRVQRVVARRRHLVGNVDGARGDLVRRPVRNAEHELAVRDDPGGERRRVQAPARQPAAVAARDVAATGGTRPRSDVANCARHVRICRWSSPGGTSSSTTNDADRLRELGKPLLVLDDPRQLGRIARVEQQPFERQAPEPPATARSPGRRRARTAGLRGTAASRIPSSSGSGDGW